MERRQKRDGNGKGRINRDKESGSDLVSSEVLLFSSSSFFLSLFILRERGRERESQTGSALSAQSPTQGLDLGNREITT